MSTSQTTSPFVGVPTERITITNSGTATWTLTNHEGTSLRSIGGYNLGEYPYYATADADTVVKEIKAAGCTLLRLVGFSRWCSNPAKGIGDSRQTGCFNLMHPDNWNRLKAYALACANNQVWFIICGEGDVLQGGTGSQDTYDHALTLVQSWETIPGGAANWGLAGGYNLYTSPYLFSMFREQWKQRAREFKSYPYLYAYELMSEPLPKSGNYSDNVANPFFYPGTLNDGVYDSAWTTGSTAVHNTIENTTRIMIQDILAIDTQAKFVIGGRTGYNLAHGELGELVTALSDPAGLGGNLVSQNIIIGTYDILASGVQADRNVDKLRTAIALNIPIYCNQLGTRYADDTTVGQDGYLNAATSAHMAFGVAPCIWEWIANTGNGYGSKYHDVGTGDANLEGGTYTLTAAGARRDTLNTRFTETLATLEAAAIAAATAENAVLYYIKSDYSNVYAADGTTLLTSGTTTLGTTTCGKITPVVDPLAVGLNFTATTTACPVIGYAQHDGSNNSWLPHRRPVFIFNGTTNLFNGSANYYASGDTQTVICAGIPADVASVQVMWELSNAGPSTHYPRMGTTSGQVPNILWTADDAVSHNLTSSVTSTTALYPMVMTGIRTGGTGANAATLKMYVNGYNEVTSSSQTLGVTTFSRLRVGGFSSSASWNGPISGWCMSKTAMSDANRIAIGRFFAYLMGGGFRA